jgi:GntR family transcriptional regulator/MocR family aminotransferase
MTWQLIKRFRRAGDWQNNLMFPYDRLVDLGLLIAKDRSGYYVSPTVYSDAPADSDRRTPDRTKDVSSPLKLSITMPFQLARVEHPPDWAKYPYPFIFNQIDPNLFPIHAWRECSRQALNRKSLGDWTRDAEEGDSSHLIQQLQQRLLSYRGIHAASEEILVTLGAQNAICIVALLLANKEKVIGIEDPGFHLARNAFQMARHRLAGVPVDDQGLIVSRIPANCQMIFATPSHQFPTAVTMSRSRRRQLLSAARSRDFLILEDDYEADLNLSAAPLLPLRTMDDRGRVIYVGSLSKTISPGMRLGFMVAHRDIIHEARIVRGLMLRHAPTVVQETAALFLGLGYHDAHLRQISRRYRHRWQAVRSAIERHLGAFHLTNTEGGTSFWLTGPPSFDASALSERLRKRGVIIDKGSHFTWTAIISDPFGLALPMLT